ncbi:hypothetical protein AMS68_002527 [Peltaster fructicola]|uniref:Nucleolar complex protein 2 n=1 Tax=Peltaster fructicola TaxID=286661 RepID=A0A6H0XRB6_9PEZI|nr:hypothetical protein AMS68_002527 [Peltaster fructicola]
MAQTKATKKFEKNQLKGTLERRNGFKKIKQKHQLKQKRKDRRAEENGQTAEDVEQGAASKRKAKPADALNSMSVDDFFQGGFEIPEQPQTNGKKRQREQVEEDDSEDSLEDVPMARLDESESESEEDDDDHEAQLAALASNDPEFHKYLQENEPELLDGRLAQVEKVEADDGEEEEPQRKEDKKVDESDEEEADAKSDLKSTKVAKWAAAMKEQQSIRAAREVVLAFRSAVHASDDDEKDFKYTISDPEVYHQLLTLALKSIPEVLQHHVPIQESKGKVKVPTESSKFKSMAPLVRSHALSIIQLLDGLSDAATLRLTLSSTIPLLPYLLSFKKLVRDLTKAVTAVWSTSSNTESTRVAAFLVLRRLAVIADSGIRENLLKSVYQGLVRSSRNTTVHTIAGMNLMKNSAAELWGFETSLGYTTGFTFIRQLAIHLRTSITNNSNESYKSVYNWQYVHSLDFWSRVLATHCTTQESPLRPLIYPLVQVTLGALRLIPTATYFPLRFQLIRALLRISVSTGTYIPLAAPLYEVLNSAEMRKAPKPSTLKPLDFATSIRAPKTFLRTRIYQDGVGDQVQELLAEFYGLWAKSIAFPELALSVVVMLKRWLKDVNSRAPGTGNKNQKVNGAMSLLVQKLEANSRFIEEKRAKVDFAPNNRKGVESFLDDLPWEKTPIGAYLAGQRKQREERAKIVEEARVQEDAKRRQKGDEPQREADHEDDDNDDDASDASMSEDE